MKKLFSLLVISVLLFSCNKNDFMNSEYAGDPLVLTGFTDAQTRTHFGTPGESKIPCFWSEGDYVWLGSVKSNPIADDCIQASFKWDTPPSTIDDLHIFYNMTGEHKTATVPAEQNANANLGANGDFGYAKADEYGVFCLDHKTSYIWFDTKTNDPALPKLKTITVKAAQGLALAGERVFDYNNIEWANSVSNASNQIVLNFGEEGIALKSENEGVFASVVTLPAAISNTEITVVYTFVNGYTFTETKKPIKDLVPGGTQRIATVISSSELEDPKAELTYELRVLTFEDKDAKFEHYSLYYADVEITKWSDLIDNPQYGGPLTYADYQNAMYYWYDENNTELTHTFPDNYAYCFWGGGHAISNYWGEGYTDDDRDNHIAKYYGQDYVDQWKDQPGADAFLGWFNVQMMVPVAPHSGNNFAVHYGYKDGKNYIVNLPEISFGDNKQRVIDHMYVVNTNYTLNQLCNGVKSEEGNTFGGNWEGLTEDAWLKIVAYGFASVDADANAEPISEVEFYLVKGNYVVEDWQKWDLSGLGKVAKVRFNFLYSEQMGGKYGFTIPGYFAYDDVAVRFDKKENE